MKRTAITLGGVMLVGLMSLTATAEASPRNPLAYAERVYQEYGPLVEQVLGVPDPGDITFETASLPFAAETLGSVITMGRRYLKTATPADLRGCLIHEMTHAFESTPGIDGAVAYWSEVLADAVRFKVNPKETNWSPSRDVLRLAALGTDEFQRFARDLADGQLDRDTIREVRSKGTR